MNINHGYDGLLIVIEGTDGAGKSTHVNMLSEYIQKKSDFVRAPARNLFRRYKKTAPTVS